MINANMLRRVSRFMRETDFKRWSILFVMLDVATDGRTLARFEDNEIDDEDVEFLRRQGFGVTYDDNIFTVSWGDDVC